MDVLESFHFFLAHLKTFQSKKKLWFLGFVMSVRLQRPDPEMEKFLADFNSHAYRNMAVWKPPKSFCPAAHCFSFEGNASQVFWEQTPALD